MSSPRLTLFSTKRYDVEAFDSANPADGEPGHVDVTYLETGLDPTCAALARGADAVCVFVNDLVDAATLDVLHEVGVGIVALRSAGYNNVDLAHAAHLGIRVVRVPAYSPNAIAEHTIALMLTLNRQIHRAHNRVRDGNFSLQGLVGFDMAGKRAAVIGTGHIGRIVARLLWHLRCDVVAVDPFQDDHLVDLGVRYVELDEALADADIITLNCPLLESTYHLIDAGTLELVKPGVMVVNTGRGALIDTEAVIDALKSGRVGSLALDVYEEEDDLFFEDRSQEVLHDDTFARLLTFPNVLITAHQAFLTREALDAIASTTLGNVTSVVAGQPCDNEVFPAG